MLHADCIFMFLTTYAPSTPSRRNSSALQEWYLSTKKFRQLVIGSINKSGRCSNGRIVTFSKGSRKYKKVFRRINYSFLGLFVTAVIYEFQKNPLKNSTVALLCNSLGCWFYAPHTSTMVYLGYIRAATSVSSSSFFDFRWPTHLRHFQLYSRVCWLTQSPGGYVRYLRSAGVSGLVLSTRFLKRWAVVLMPSGSIKLFWNRVCGYSGWVMHEQGGLFYLNKAGAYVNAGVKPRVRGTVRNSNDHPNGGRNRSLLCSKTPWGYPAKKSRFPAAKTKMKALAKRMLDDAVT